MSRHYGPVHHGGPSIIRSLTFESNFKKYGPYGVEHDNWFTFPMSGGKIVGFHGRCGWFLDSVGFYLSSIHSAIHVSSPDLSLVLASPEMSRSVSLKSQDGGATSKTYNILLALGESKDNVNLQYSKLDSITENSPSLTSFQSRRIDNFSSKVLQAYGSEKSMSVKAPIAYGSWGENYGSIFDDGVYTGVRQIVLNRGAGIASIQIEYDINSLLIWGNHHGETSSGFKTNKPPLNVGRGMHESAFDLLKYTLFWLLLIATKLVFSYYIEIKPLISPTKAIMKSRIHTYDSYEFFPQGIIYGYTNLVCDIFISVWRYIWCFSPAWRAMLRSRFKAFPGSFDAHLVPPKPERQEDIQRKKKNLKRLFTTSQTIKKK